MLVDITKDLLNKIGGVAYVAASKGYVEDTNVEDAAQELQRNGNNGAALAGWCGKSTVTEALAWAEPLFADPQALIDSLVAAKSDGVFDVTNDWNYPTLSIPQAVALGSVYYKILLRCQAVDEKNATDAGLSTAAYQAARNVAEAKDMSKRTTIQTGATTAAKPVAPVTVDILADGEAVTADAYVDDQKIDDDDVADGSILTTLKDYDRNVFSQDAKVFLEGIEMPFSQCSVSYGIGAPATCTLVIPAHRCLRSIPEHTRIHIIFKDIIKANGENEWRLLFDGEVAGVSTDIGPNGVNMQISGMHSVSYLQQLQLIFMDAAGYMYDPTQKMLGAACFVTVAGFNKNDINLIENLVKRKDTFKSMADLVYLLLYNLIHGANRASKTADGKKTVDASPMAQAIYNKLGSMWDGSADVAGSWKILKRIYGVSDVAHAAPLINKWDKTGATKRTTYTAKGDGGSSVDAASVDPKSITSLKKIYEMAVASRGSLDHIYLHWSAGTYTQVHDCYHINVTGDGTIYSTVSDLSTVLGHTLDRNTGAVGISIDCVYDASVTTEGQVTWGSAPPTSAQINGMAQAAAAVCAGANIPVSESTIMTHYEVAVADGYAPGSKDPDIRWDLWYLPVNGSDVLGSPYIRSLISANISTISSLVGVS